MQARSCPLCGANEHETVLELEADAFCRTNWTYSADFRTILGIGDRALFPVVRCRRCAMVFAALLPDDDFLTALYDRVIGKAECVAGSENRPGYARRLRYVAELLELAPPGDPLRALDYGSGLGVTLRLLRACGVDSTGFDPSAIRNEYVGEHELTTVSDRSALQGIFSIVVLDNVLEHLPDPAATLEWLRGVTAAGAVAYVSVPPYESDFVHEQVGHHRRGEPLDMTLNPWEHLNYFSLAHLDTLMLRGGFRRLAASRRAAAPGIGLRPERSAARRGKNAAASMARLVRYALRGDVLATAEHAFYRRES
ncbi:MAG TPA: class I SAM-dependent methyltransferase [Thermoanaerobaculia bacterium]